MGGLYVSRFWFAVDRLQCAWPDFLKLIRNSHYPEDTQGNRATFNLKYQGESPMRSFRNRFSLSILLFCALPLAVAQNDLCVDKSNVDTHTPPCSFTALNASCTLTIDRLRPVASPQIYVRHGDKITVLVLHSSPFEKLTLDLGSATAQVPTDSFSDIFSKLLPALEQIKMVGVSVPQPSRVSSKSIRAINRSTPEIKSILDEQNALLTAINAQSPITKAHNALKLIKESIQPPPVDARYWAKDKPNPWTNIEEWKSEVDQGLNSAVTIDLHGGMDSNAVDSLIASLDKRIIALPPEVETSDERTSLQSIQKDLDTAWKTLKPTLTKLQLLKAAVDGYNCQKCLWAEATVDYQSGDKNDLNEKWNLDSVNTLLPKVKSAVADPPADPDTAALSDLTNPPAVKQLVVAIQVLYQTPQRIETSAGLMVPMLPYHSYASAAAASGGTITGYVVQESKTYAVVPSVQVNFVAHEWILKQQRAALFGTVAVGYNSATSNVEFGAGPSFSWKTILISGLLDIGRDKKLAGGFTVGESLGTTSVTPLTSDVWRIKPAVGISVRIPLGK
jgi:hypothetical protein